MCPLIPKLDDFKKRVWCASHIVVFRREQFIQRGIYFDYLQHEELITSTREWESRVDACSGQVFVLNLALIRATTRNQYL